jgi:hypothetical protein
MARREDVPVLRLKLGNGAGQVVDVHGFPACVYGIPLVQISGGLEYLEHLTIEQAEQLANGLMIAARMARGIQPPPSALEEFLSKRASS